MAAPERANVVYYFDVGVGRWRGSFRLKITSWRAFFRDPIGPKYRFLTLWLVATLDLFGPPPIVSRLGGDPGAGEAGTVANSVRITRFGIPVYALDEHYVLDPDGRGVHVVANERFGPIPFLFRDHKEHSAKIEDGGMRAVYDLPLLGTRWVATYRVRPDREHIDSTLVCGWAEAHETIHKV